LGVGAPYKVCSTLRAKPGVKGVSRPGSANNSTGDTTKLKGVDCRTADKVRDELRIGVG